jgi:pyridoxamine 5'-phosphate oxidase family protein
MTLSAVEIDYLASQLLGRLATVAPDGSPQVNPVGFRYDAERGVIEIGGHDLASTRKFRNIAAGSQAALVVDDLVSTQPWQVRGVEIRGDAEALHGQEPFLPGFSDQLIRIHPRRVISWGVDPDQPHARDVTP